MAKIIDRTKNHTEFHTNKKGQVVKKLVSNIKKEAKPKEWWQNEKIMSLKLSRYPMGIPKDQVQIMADLDNQEDCNKKCVMKWKDPKTGSDIRSYTKTFLDRNADYKWDRMKKFDVNIINDIKQKAKDDLSNKNEKFAEAAAIILIIAKTGLRVGQTAGLEKTGNVGVSTISPDHINITKDNKINFEFVGKSYKLNTAEISDEPELAKYLKKLKTQKTKDGKTRMFSMDRTFVDKVFKNKYGYKDLKIKDMRTYIATSTANDILNSAYDEVKSKLSGDDKKDKKVINDCLKDVYKKVSEQLNNTPKMAETAYIHPLVRINWLTRLGLNSDIINKSNDSKWYDNFDDLLSSYQPEVVEIDENDEEECDEYNLLSIEHQIELNKSITSDRLKKLINRKFYDLLNDDEFFQYTCDKNTEDRDSGELDSLSVDERYRLLKEYGAMQKSWIDVIDKLSEDVDSNDLIEKSKHRAIIKQRSKSGKIYERSMQVGSNKDATKSKFFELDKIGEDYNKHLTDLVESGGNSYYKIVKQKGTSYDSGAGRNTNKVHQSETDNLLKVYTLHPDEEKYREKLLKNVDKDVRKAYEDKVHSYRGAASVYDKTEIAYDKDKELHDKFVNVTKNLLKRDGTSYEEIHIKNETSVGKKIQEEKQKKEAEKQEILNKEQVERNRNLFNEQKEKYKTLVEKINSDGVDLSQISFREFHDLVFIKSGMRNCIGSHQIHPISRNNDVKVYWNSKEPTVGKMGDFYNWVKKKALSEGMRDGKLPFTKFEILNWDENPY